MNWYMLLWLLATVEANKESSSFPMSIAKSKEIVLLERRDQTAAILVPDQEQTTAKFGELRESLTSLKTQGLLSLNGIFDIDNLWSLTIMLFNAIKGTQTENWTIEPSYQLALPIIKSIERITRFINKVLTGNLENPSPNRRKRSTLVLFVTLKKGGGKIDLADYPECDGNPTDYVRCGLAIIDDIKEPVLENLGNDAIVILQGITGTSGVTMQDFAIINKKLKIANKRTITKNKENLLKMMKARLKRGGNDDQFIMGATPPTVKPTRKPVRKSAANVNNAPRTRGRATQRAKVTSESTIEVTNNPTTEENQPIVDDGGIDYEGEGTQDNTVRRGNSRRDTTSQSTENSDIDHHISALNDANRETRILRYLNDLTRNLKGRVSALEEKRDEIDEKLFELSTLKEDVAREREVVSQKMGEDNAASLNRHKRIEEKVNNLEGRIDEERLRINDVVDQRQLRKNLEGEITNRIEELKTQKGKLEGEINGLKKRITDENAELARSIGRMEKRLDESQAETEKTKKADQAAWEKRIDVEADLQKQLTAAQGRINNLENGNANLGARMRKLEGPGVVDDLGQTFEGGRKVVSWELEDIRKRVREVEKGLKELESEDTVDLMEFDPGKIADLRLEITELRNTFNAEIKMQKSSRESIKTRLSAVEERSKTIGRTLNEHITHMATGKSTTEATPTLETQTETSKDATATQAQLVVTSVTEATTNKEKSTEPGTSILSEPTEETLLGNLDSIWNPLNIPWTEMQQLAEKANVFMAGAEGNYQENQEALLERLEKLENETLHLRNELNMRKEIDREKIKDIVLRELGEIKELVAGALAIIDDQDTTLFRKKGKNIVKIHAVYKTGDTPYIVYTSFEKSFKYELFENVKLCGHQVCVSRKGEAFLSRDGGVTGISVGNCTIEKYQYVCADEERRIQCQKEMEEEDCPMNTTQRTDESGQEFLREIVRYEVKKDGDKKGVVLVYPKKVNTKTGEIYEANPTQYKLTMEEIDEKYGNETTKEDEENKGGNWWDSEDLNGMAPILGSGTALLTIGYALYIGYSKYQERKEIRALKVRLFEIRGK